MITEYKLSLSPQQMQVVFAGLMELPGKVAFETVETVRGQIQAQEQPEPPSTPADQSTPG
jgi:hypothetical protein